MEDHRVLDPVTALPADDARQLIAELTSSWQQAARDDLPRQITVRIAGVTVALQAVDTELFERLSPALAHLGVEAGTSVDLTVRLWSLAATGARRPRVPEVFRRCDDVVAHVDAGVVRARFDHPNRAVMAWSSASAEAWWCIEATEGLQWWEEAAPLRPILSWFLPSRGVHFAHGAAVGDGDGAVMLVGPGGSGKSTTALACHLAGMGYVGDDYCAVTVDGSPAVHSLYGTAKLRLDAGVEHGPLAGYLLRPTPPPGGKAVALVAARPGAHIVTSAPVVAVAAVHVADAEHTVVSDATRPEVLAALAPSSLSQLPGVGAESFAALTAVVRSVPVCRMALGRDREGVVAAVRSLVADRSFRTGARR